MKQLEKMKRSLFYLLLVLAALAVLTACGSKAAMAADKIELGQKYLTELNYTEAIASFTEAIKLDPNNIQAYMGRAEAYLALGEYDKALKDYQFVCGKTEEMPYTRALSYIGQAEVYERTDKPEKALSDYELSKALLNASDAGKAEDVSEEGVGVKLVQVLYAHAALCETLKNYNTALEDYNDLLELGENTAAKRDEVLSQLGETAEDENGLTDTEEPAADADAAKRAEETPEEKSAESAKEEPVASSGQAASSKASVESTVSSEAASSSSASSEAPAESKTVVQEPVTLKVDSVKYGPDEVDYGWGLFMEQCDDDKTITYQVGGNTVQMHWTRIYKANGEPYEKYDETVVYTLSAPIQSVETGAVEIDACHENTIMLTVPEGTNITAKTVVIETALSPISPWENSSFSSTTFGVAKFSSGTSLKEIAQLDWSIERRPDLCSSLAIQSGAKYLICKMDEKAQDEWGVPVFIFFRAN